jgi:hypothetical protein
VLSEKPLESESSYNFEIDMDKEIMNRNVISDEFVYGQDEEELEEGDLADFASEDVSAILGNR